MHQNFVHPHKVKVPQTPPGPEGKPPTRAGTVQAREPRFSVQGLTAGAAPANLSTMVLPAAPSEQITQLEWKRVQEMIADVESQGRREDFARWLFRWDFAVREFRKVEQRLIILGEPSGLDWHSHALCLHSLLATGHAIILASKGFQAEELSQFGGAHFQIEAYVAELEQSLREWHHGFAEAEISELQQAIFGRAS